MKNGQGTDLSSVLLHSLTSMENMASPQDSGVLEEGNITGTDLNEDTSDVVTDAFVEENPSAQGLDVVEANQFDAYSAGTAVADTLTALAEQAEQAADSPAATVALESIRFTLTAMMNSHRIDYAFPSMESPLSAGEQLRQLGFSARNQAEVIRQNLYASMENAAQTQLDQLFKYEDMSSENAKKLKVAIGVIKANKAKLDQTPVEFDHKTILHWLSVDGKPVTNVPQAIATEIQSLGKLTAGVKKAGTAIEPLIVESKKASPTVPQAMKILETFLSFNPASVVKELENLHFLYNSKLITETVKGSRGDSYLVITDRWGGQTKDGSKAPLAARLKNTFRSAVLGGLAAASFATGLVLPGIIIAGATAMVHSRNADELNKKHQGAKTKSVVKPDDFINALAQLEGLLPLLSANGRVLARVVDDGKDVPSYIGRLISVIRTVDDKKASEMILAMVNKHAGGEKITGLTEAKDYLIDRWYYAKGIVTNLGGFAQVQIFDDISAGSRAADKIVAAVTGKKD